MKKKGKFFDIIKGSFLRVVAFVLGVVVLSGLVSIPAYAAEDDIAMETNTYYLDFTYAMDVGKYGNVRRSIPEINTTYKLALLKTGFKLDSNAVVDASGKNNEYICIAYDYQNSGENTFFTVDQLWYSWSPDGAVIAEGEPGTWSFGWQKVTNETAWQDYPVEGNIWSGRIMASSIDTNIPIFSSSRDMYEYFYSFDLDFESALFDDTFYINDFISSHSRQSYQYQVSTTSASWSGFTCTSLTDITGIDFYIKVDYKLSSIGDVSNIREFSGGIYDLNLLSLSDSFSLPDISVDYVSLITFTPFYISSGQIYKGKSEFLALDSSGVIDGTFYSSSVFCEDFTLDSFKSSIVNNVFFIDWGKASRPSASIGLDQYTIDVYAIFSNASSTYKMDVKNLLVQEHYSVDYSLYWFDTPGWNNHLMSPFSDIIGLLDSESVWDGEIWVTPYFIKDNIKYYGQTYSVDVYNGEASIIQPDPGNPDFPYDPSDPVYTPINPPSGGDDGGLFDLDFSLETLVKLAGFLWDFLASLVNGLGRFPALLSSVFSFMPSYFFTAISVMFVVIFLLRIFGR